MWFSERYSATLASSSGVNRVLLGSGNCCFDSLSLMTTPPIKISRHFTTVAFLPSVTRWLEFPDPSFFYSPHLSLFPTPFCLSCLAPPDFFACPSPSLICCFHTGPALTPHPPFSVVGGVGSEPDRCGNLPKKMGGAACKFNDLVAFGSDFLSSPKWYIGIPPFLRRFLRSFGPAQRNLRARRFRPRSTDPFCAVSVLTESWNQTRRYRRCRAAFQIPHRALPLPAPCFRRWFAGRP